MVGGRNAESFNIPTLSVGLQESQIKSPVFEKVLFAIIIIITTKSDEISPGAIKA